jgi:hypothetical protein
MKPDPDWIDAGRAVRFFFIIVAMVAIVSTVVVFAGVFVRAMGWL